MTKNTWTIKNLGDLRDVFGRLPDGTTADIPASDLEAGNFETVHIVMPGTPRPGGSNSFDIHYTGPVAEGYVSPTEEDLAAHQYKPACALPGRTKP